MRSIRYLSQRSDSGRIAEGLPDFTSGMLRDIDGQLASDEEIVTAALRIVAKKMRSAPVLSHPRATRDYVTLRFADLEHEVFAILFLDNRHRVIAFEELFRGTVDGASVHPREVVKRVLCHNASAVIFTHNHPSGVAEPSQADQLITRRLKDALSLIEVRVLDHLVVGGTVVESFAERGLL